MNKYRFYIDDTGFLFANPSFVSGIAGVLDLGGSLVVYNESKSEREADWRALASDWALVGRHLIKAAEKIEKEEQAKAA